MIRVSAGSAAVLGLIRARLDAAPTTAYLMSGNHCRRACAFCAQARGAVNRGDLLSRVTWPEFDRSKVVDKITEAHRQGLICRACIQMVVEPEAHAKTIEMIRALKHESAIPLSVSASGNRRQIEEMFTAGADRVSVALDAASADIYRRVKAENFTKTKILLFDLAEKHPAKMSTHLIAGLGETDEQLLGLADELFDRGITVALFAFTPIKGSRMQNVKPPPLARYRALQAGLYLLRHGFTDVSSFGYRNGDICDFGMDAAAFGALPGSADAFRTSGCDDCNRPYYNEKPGGDMYNYPVPLNEPQKHEAIDLAFLWAKGRIQDVGAH